MYFFDFLAKFHLELKNDLKIILGSKPKNVRLLKLSKKLGILLEKRV